MTHVQCKSCPGLSLLVVLNVREVSLRMHQQCWVCCIALYGHQTLWDTLLSLWHHLRS
jgi:hypothetical protein